MDFKKYFEELKRRKVFKSAVAYLAVAWVLIEVASAVLPAFDTPPLVLKTLIILLALGFPVNLVFSWVYDLTPEGLKRTDDLPNTDVPSQIKGRRLNKVIIGFLSLAVIILLYNQFGRSHQNNGTAPSDLNEHSNIKSIAVLPFQNLSPDSTNQFYCNGIMQNVINDLSKIPEFRVLPSRTTNLYKDTDLLPTELGEELGVTYIIDGSFQKIDSLIQVTLSLTNTEDGSQIWTSKNETFTIEELFSMQAQIANQVATQLKTSLNDDLDTSFEAIPTRDELAYEYYLRGKEELRSINYLSNPETERVISLNKARQFFNLAIERDTNFAPAYLGLARTFYANDGNYFQFKFLKDTNALSKYKKSVEQALVLDPDLDEGYFLKGIHELNALQSPPGAENNWRKALDKNPNNIDALYALAQLNLWETLDIVEGVRLLKEIEYRILDELELCQVYLALSQAYSKVLDLDTEWYYLEKFNKLDCSERNERDIQFALALPWYYLRIGQTQKAIEELTERFPKTNNQFQLIIRGLYYSQNGQFQEAVKYYEQWEKLEDVQSPDNWFSINDWFRYGEALVKTGKDSLGLSLIQRQISIFKKGEERGRPNYYDLAGMYSFLNEKDSAYYYLDKMYEKGGFLGSWGNPSFILVDYQFDNIRSDARFIELFEAEKNKMREIRKQLSSVDPNARELE